MSQEAFHQKWADIRTNKKPDAVDERSLFVEPGNEPMTQRQLNLYNYFLFIERILREIDAKEVAEVGCGRGTMALYLAKYLDMHLTLLDNEEDAMKLAVQAFQDHGIDGDFHVGDALQTNFEDNAFDAVVSIGLAEHFPSVDDLFAEQYRILRPGGMMISLNIPKKFSIQSLNTVHRFCKKCVGLYKDSVRKDYYRNTLRPNEFKQAAERVGFTSTEVTHVCPFTIYVPIEMRTDKLVTRMRKLILALRRPFVSYPYKTNPIIAQAHFLVGKKPGNASGA